MDLPAFKRIPSHIAVIPDGNRRWAEARGLAREEGYAHGVPPLFELCDICLALGISEVTLYGFTQDNTKRPAVQRIAFQQAIINAMGQLEGKDVAVLLVGDTDSPMFPEQLRPYTTRTVFGKGLLKVNALVNYDWHWDLSQAIKDEDRYGVRSRKTFVETIGSSDISRVDLVIRWGGRRRLSGLLPVQTVYADFFILDELWPDFQPDQFYAALRWYEGQDITLGG